VVLTARSLRVDADLGALAKVRAFVGDAATAAGAPEACRSDIVQAVDEAATNAIVHGYAGATGWLEVRAAMETGQFVIQLEDAAPEFDPTTVAPPDLSVAPHARKPGGMGVHLMRQCTDAMTHRPRPGGGNILTLVRAVRPDWNEEG
jgi:serine/threonine-protein kinase RsbW